MHGETVKFTYKLVMRGKDLFSIFVYLLLLKLKVC